MSEESHNSSIEPELEARIVALVLGEASDFEREELNRLIAQRLELAAFRLRMQEVHGLLQDAGAGEFQAPDDDWKLPTERRSLVLAVIRGEAAIPPAVQPENSVARQSIRQRISGVWNLRWKVATVVATVCVAGIFGIMTLPYFRDFESMLAARWGPRNAKFTAVGGSLDESFVAHMAQDHHSLKKQTDVDFWFGNESDARDVKERGSARLASGDSGQEKDAASALSALQDALKVKAAPQSLGYAVPPLTEGVADAGIHREQELGALTGQLKEPSPRRESGDAEKRLDSQVRAMRDYQHMQEMARQKQPLAASDDLREKKAENSDAGANGVETANVEPNVTLWGVTPGAAASDKKSVLPPSAAVKDGNGNGQVESDPAVASTSELAFPDPLDSWGDIPERALAATVRNRTLAVDGKSDWYGAVDAPTSGEKTPTDGRITVPTPEASSDLAKSDGEQLGREAKSLDDVRLYRNDKDNDRDGLSRGDLSRTADDGTGGVAQDDRGLGNGRFGDGGLRGRRPGAIGGAPPGEPSGEAKGSRPAIRREHADVSGSDMNGPSQVASAGRPSDRKSEVAADSAGTESLESQQQATPQQGDQKAGGEGSGGNAVRLAGTPDREEQLKERRNLTEREVAAAKVPAKKNPAGKPVAPPAALDEKTAAEEAFSTFSLHVSDVSFKLAAAALARGEWPEAAKIRIEEFYNAFDYGDPLPSGGEKVACRIEQSIHPSVQQRNLLRVSLRTAAEGRANNTPLRLTLLLDNSGSMERTDRRETVRRAFALLARQLSPVDQVTLISFARQPRLLAEKVSGAESGRLVRLIDELPSEGGTNIEAALQLAFEKATQQQTPGAQSRVILLTDGAVNLGDADPDSLSQIVTAMRDTGIAFDAAGISAEGLNDTVLEALARRGDGRYYLLDSAEAADDSFARQVAGALRPSASNVKVQVEFNPKRVGRYRLLGFEKHLLKQEDFRNDAVDAAEMAAAEAGVAVYQFEAKPDGEGDVGSVSVRFRDLSTGQMVEHRWPIPYEADAPRPDQAAPSLRIATVAALLATKLRGEPLGETVDLPSLSQLISGLPTEKQRNTRVQQLKLMIEQARQLSGK